MVGGDIAVNGGSTVISGTLSGTIRDIGVTKEGCLHIGRYDAVRTGKYSADGGTIYTSDMKKLEQDITDLEKEQVMFANFSKATRVTPEEALRRYQLIKDGKVSQLYDPQTLSNLQKDAGDHWMEVAAMDLYGLKGGKKFWKKFFKAVGLVASIAVPFVAPVLTPVAAVTAAASMSALDGRSHSVGVATDGHNVAVGVDGGASHVLHQKQKAEREHNRMLEGAQVPAPLKKMKSTYGLAVEGMPERIRLAREIRSLFKPADFYAPKYHKFRPAPVEQIKRAFALTGDAKPYRLHRDLYSRLYDALQKSSVEQAYIAAMWGDPYLHTITHWAAIPQERRENLTKEYPEMQDLAEEVEEAKRELAPDLLPASYDAQAFVNDIAIVGLSILNRGKTSKVAATSGARALAYIAPRCEKIATSISRETRVLCRKVENFFKKKAGKPAGEEAKKRVIPTAQSKVDWHVKMVKSGKWKPCHGEWRGYYEGKAPNDTRVYRFKPTFEKHEYEVYREYENKGLHCGVFRTEGGRALEVIEELAKWTFRGKW